MESKEIKIPLHDGYLKVEVVENWDLVNKDNCLLIPKEEKSYVIRDLNDDVKPRYVLYFTEKNPNLPEVAFACLNAVNFIFLMESLNINEFRGIHGQMVKWFSKEVSEFFYNRTLKKSITIKNTQEGLNDRICYAKEYLSFEIEKKIRRKNYKRKCMETSYDVKFKGEDVVVSIKCVLMQ